METCKPLDGQSRRIGADDLIVATALAGFAVCILLSAWRDSLRIALKDEECSYVLIAPVVILWLGWVRRRQLAPCTVRGGWVGLLALAIGWGVYWYGYLKDPVVWRAGAVVVAVGAFMAGVGFDCSRRLAPALLACVFLVPVDPNGRYRIAQPLQTVTADVAQRACDLIGMSVDRSGNLLSVNGVDVTVAEACNGMRMVLTLFLVCYVVAFTVQLRAWLRVVVLAASPVFAIASNVARLVPTLWVFGHASAKTAERFHELSGWVMTVLAFGVLMAVLRMFHGGHEPSGGSAGGGGREALTGPGPCA